MSIQALNWALNQDVIENSGAKFVLMILSNYADEDGYCYPSRETIALKTGLKVRAVQDHLNWLFKGGYITKTPRRFEKKITTNCYQVQFKEMPKSDKKHSADSAHCTKKHSADSAEHSAENDEKHSADSALTYKEDTKAVKEDTKAHTQKTDRNVRSEFSPVKPSNGKTAIPITEILPAEIQPGDLPDQFHYARQIWAYLESQRIDSPAENPKWEEAIDFSRRRNFTVEEFIGTVNYLKTDPEQLKWRKGRIAASTVTNNLQHYVESLAKSAVPDESVYVNPMTGRSFK